MELSVIEPSGPIAMSKLRVTVDPSTPAPPAGDGRLHPPALGAHQAWVVVTPPLVTLSRPAFAVATLMVRPRSETMAPLAS